MKTNYVIYISHKNKVKEIESDNVSYVNLHKPSIIADHGENQVKKITKNRGE